ncbi:TetR/AcrR family transcriptional regulator [Spirosoma rigui]|uniref:TetR/AcrR family transcriptional regulator n=1 Tax=Spirosoma rigui TaxID=564064 RepID=UPI0009AF601A|nr:TetR/AcrR family transcriptional regulator [Spirosoma rigui]
MTRDRTQTEQRLIDAVGQEITENGFDKLGINRISNRAGVNKVLIYRYFGDLNGLIKEYYKRTHPIIPLPDIDLQELKDAPLDEYFDRMYDQFTREFRRLRANTDAKEFIKSALTSPNWNQNPAAGNTEVKLQEKIDTLSEIVQEKNGRPMAAIMISAMTVLTLMSHQKRTLFGIDLASEEGWQQIEDALSTLNYGIYLATSERLSGTGKKAA